MENPILNLQNQDTNEESTIYARKGHGSHGSIFCSSHASIFACG